MNEPKQRQNIHYFPGHMAKAFASLTPYLKSSDLVVEIADARAPSASRNPMLLSLLGEKPHLLMLSKLDRADPKETESWLSYYRKQGENALAGDLKHEKVIRQLLQCASPIITKKRAKEQKIGMKPQPLRLLVLGIPNVGKSTFINNLAGRNAAKAANHPGVTRAEQWVKVSQDFVLLDTPGILPMNYPSEEQAILLACLGSIKEEVLPLDALADSLLSLLRSRYPSCLASRYGISDMTSWSDETVYDGIAKRMGYIGIGGNSDTSKARSGLLKDFQDGLLGRLSLEGAPC